VRFQGPHELDSDAAALKLSQLEESQGRLSSEESQANLPRWYLYC